MINKRLVSGEIFAGLVVFLVALPLCMGIALASGAPIISGLITGIIGGIVVSLLSGSELSVSGPAAGLTVIVSSYILKLGGFETFLISVFLAGLIQVVFGLLRAGALTGLFSNAVVNGMLAAIGLSIIFKQIPHGVGSDLDFEGNFAFWNEGTVGNSWSYLLEALSGIQPVALGIFLSGVLLMIYWADLVKWSPVLRKIPSALVVVFVGLLLNEGILSFVPDVGLGKEHLVQLPDLAGGKYLLANFKLPDIAAFSNVQIWVAAFTIALVASLETLLCIEATDQMDPKRRVSNMNRELVAQGLGNTLCGLFGGIPMTSVIVRSSTNVYAGAQTRYSSFVHGLFLLAAGLIFASLLNKIPLSALAAVLCVVGYKLATPKLFRRFYRLGLNQFLPFFATVVAIFFTDLLIGVGIGFIVGLLVLIKSNSYGALVAINEGNYYFIQFTKDVSFFNKMRLRSILRKIPDGSKVFVDGSRAMFIDWDIVEVLNEFRRQALRRRIQTRFIEVRGKSYHLRNRKREKVSHALSQTFVAVQ